MSDASKGSYTVEQNLNSKKSVINAKENVSYEILLK